MPLIIKDFTWSQTDDEVFIRVPLKNISRRKPDFHIYYTYIKISCGQYFLELFLSHSIDVNASRCKIFEHELRFQLKKASPLQWDKLERTVGEKQKIKEFILKKTAVMLAEEQETAINQKEEKKRAEIRREIEKQSSELKLIEDYKNDCKKGFYEEMGEKMAGKIKQKKLEAMTDVENISTTKKLVVKPEQRTQRTLPPIRNAEAVAINFTERRFSTPQRESQNIMEKEWLLRQIEIQKAIGYVEADLRPEERDPRYLKTKAEDFASKKNYFGAISAYTTAIKISKEPNYELFMGRASVQFNAGNFKRSAEDYSEAYELLPKDLNITTKLRAQCVGKRALALSNLGFKNEALRELEIALKIDPTNLETKADLEKLEEELDDD